MPRIVDADRRRRDIARSAMRVFARRGYRLASMGEVARGCAVGRTTLYQSFPDKNALIDYCVGTALSGTVHEAQVIARQQGLTWRERLRKVLAVGMGAFQADPAQALVTLEFWLELCRSRAGSPGRKQLERLGAAAGQIQKVLSSVLWEGVGAGELPARHVRGLAFLTYSLLLSFCLQGVVNPQAPPGRFLGQMDRFVDAWASLPAPGRASEGGRRPDGTGPRRHHRSRRTAA